MDSMLRTHFDWLDNDTPEQWAKHYYLSLNEEDARKFLAVSHLLRQYVPDDATTPAGENSHRHVLRTAQMVAQMDLLPESVLATVASSLPRHISDWKIKLLEASDQKTVDLVYGLIQVRRLTDFIHQGEKSDEPEERARQAEIMRKMLLAMVSDIRVVIVKLALRTRTMQYLGRVPDSPQKRAIAKETLEIFAPLANRLGVWQLKWQLEDLGFRYQYPEEYRQIADALDENRNERVEYINDFTKKLQNTIQSSGIDCKVSGRAKHIYSIWRKMQKKNLSFSGLYDIRAVRVLVEKESDCYAVLGIVHNLWQPISGQFDDYIAHPKPNKYQSLHTVVIGPESKGVEVQIRTFAMHDFAENGVAAHWRYKEGNIGDSEYEQKITLLRQLLDWRDTMAKSDKKDLTDAFKNELLNDTIYVLTPQGRVLSLPEGSTPIDFAYALHTDLGHRCRGAKVNGQIVPLSTALENGQRVEIITAKTGNPPADWLHQGWVKSGKAINRIRAFIRSQNQEVFLEEGEKLLEKNLARNGLHPNLQKLAEKCGFEEIKDLYSALGRGELGTPTLIKCAHELLQPIESESKNDISNIRINKGKKNNRNGILINGESGLLTTLAKCCKPAPPDKILGFVTRDRGISIHRENCSSLHTLITRHPEKVLEASWIDSGFVQNVFPVDIEVVAHDRPGLLRDVSDAFAREKINLIGVQTRTNDLIAVMKFTIEVRQTDDVQRVLNGLMNVDQVLSVRRM